ncbi:hypothetical protein B566_EDAN009090, partial [Ephemera danica]
MRVVEATAMTSCQAICGPAAVRSACEILRQAAQADRGGHCLELACVLGCILLGAGYNALVVSGYASRRLCLHEQTREPCPYLKPAPPSFLPQQHLPSSAWSRRLSHQVASPVPHQRAHSSRARILLIFTPPTSSCHRSQITRSHSLLPACLFTRLLHHEPSVSEDAWSEDGQNGTTVYRVQPRKTFESQYIKTMDQQAQQKSQKELERQSEARRQKLEEEERLPPDELHGRRVHCWILVLPGGYRNDVEKPFYLEPASGNAFDLEDSSYMGIESVWNHHNYWFYTQIHSPKPLEYDLTDKSSWIPLIDEEVDKNLDMPDSWMNRITISGEAYQTRYPGGSKTILYKRSKLELFAELSRPDGLTVRVTQFSDLEWTDALQETSVFKHRQDSLLTSLVDLQLQKVTDSYGEGRADHVKEHEYFLNGSEERRIHFYNSSHPEGLTLWQVQPKCVIEQYDGHSENLCRREMWFTNADGLVEITIEEFLREENLPVTQKQIAKRKFFHLENKIFLKYHHAPDQITAGYLHFLKPADDSKFGVEHIHEYEPYNPVGKKYNEKDTKILIQNQLDAEAKNVNHAGQIYSKIQNLLVKLKRDRENPGLNSSIFDEQRNQKLVHLMEKQGDFNFEREDEGDSLLNSDTNPENIFPRMTRVSQYEMSRELQERYQRIREQAADQEQNIDENASEFEIPTDDNSFVSSHCWYLSPLASLVHNMHQFVFTTEESRIVLHFLRYRIIATIQEINQRIDLLLQSQRNTQAELDTIEPAPDDERDEPAPDDEPPTYVEVISEGLPPIIEDEDEDDHDEISPQSKDACAHPRNNRELDSIEVASSIIIIQEPMDDMDVGYTLRVIDIFNEMSQLTKYRDKFALLRSKEETLNEDELQVVRSFLENI